MHAKVNTDAVSSTKGENEIIITKPSGARLHLPLFAMSLTARKYDMPCTFLFFL